MPSLTNPGRETPTAEFRANHRLTGQNSKTGSSGLATIRRLQFKVEAVATIASACGCRPKILIQ